MFVLLSGKAQIDGRDGLGHVRTVQTYKQRDEFTADITQLSNQPPAVDAYIMENVEALLISPAQLSAVMVAEADVGEKIMRTLILRRILAIERAHGAVVGGDSNSAQLVALQNFLRRNDIPYATLDAANDPKQSTPLSVCPDSRRLSASLLPKRDNATQPRPAAACVMFKPCSRLRPGTRLRRRCCRCRPGRTCDSCVRGVRGPFRRGV
ncbi:hypothetical protein [Paraburkholderia strydomiana]